MNVSIIHCSSKIVFLILNYLSFFLHARNVSENTIYRICSHDSFFGDSKEGFIICTLLYGTRNIEEIKNLPFHVAGKTGSTGSPNEQERMINHSLFIAYAPTKDPQIAISVVIPGSNPEKNIAALVTSEVLKSWNILQKKDKDKEEGSLK